MKKEVVIKAGTDLFFGSLKITLVNDTKASVMFPEEGLIANSRQIIFFADETGKANYLLSSNSNEDLAL